MSEPAAPRAPRSFADVGPLLLILAVAAALRLLVIYGLPSLHYPDETYQLYEQGHRLAFGYGVRPWEFEVGLRSYVAPLAIAGVFRLAEPVFGGPRGYLDCAEVVIAALSLIPVAAVYRMGAWTSRTHAILGALVVATWFEIVYFAARPLTEALAASVAMTALALASAPAERLSTRRLALIGACLGLTVMLRIHLAPGAGFVAVWICRLDVRRRWLPMVLGAVPILMVFGAVDAWFLGAPFISFVRSIQVNIGEGKAARYGASPARWYGEAIVAIWGAALAPMALLIFRRWRASILWVGFAAIVIVVHTLISHKEYRFIFPALACLVVVASQGSADWVEARRAAGGPVERRLAMAAVGWVAVSAALSVSGVFAAEWTRSRDQILAASWMAGRPELCGLAIYDTTWQNFGGYASLHRRIPIYPFSYNLPHGRASTAAFNMALVKRSAVADFAPAYRPAWCAAGRAADGLCVVERQGACARIPGLSPLLERTRLGDIEVN